MIENPVGFTPKKALVYIEFVQQAYYQYFNFIRLKAKEQTPAGDLAKILMGHQVRDEVPFEVPFGYRHLWDIWATDIDPLVKLLKFECPFGFAALSPDETQLVIAIRGTEGPLEWLEDLLGLGQVPWPDPQSEGMILEVVSSIYKNLYWTLPGETVSTEEGMPDLNISGLESCVITGHSLGACLMLPVAVVSAHALPEPLNPTVYSFAGGRIGNKSFAISFDNLIPEVYRIVNRLDVVPDVPPRHMLWLKSKRFWLRKSWGYFRYEHVGDRVPIGPRFSILWLFHRLLSLIRIGKIDLGHYHELATYRQQLEDLDRSQ